MTPTPSSRRRRLGDFLPGRAGFWLAWLQLSRERRRFLLAVLGITAAAVMMLFQLDLKDALYRQALAPFDKIRADLYVFSGQYEYIGNISHPRTVGTGVISRALALPEVAGAYPLWLAALPFKNPQNGKYRDIFVMAADPRHPVFADPEIERQREHLADGQGALMDALAHPEFGEFAPVLAAGGTVRAEVNDAAVDIAGTFRMSTTFIADGNLVTSRDAFMRMYPGLSPQTAMAGVIQLKPGADAAAAARRLSALLPAGTRVLTAAQARTLERDYWSDRTPIGLVVHLTLLIEIVVGAIIIAQILYTDVSDHLPEYATLKSIGFSNGYFRKLVLQEAAILSSLGFALGLLLTLPAYPLARGCDGILHQLVHNAPNMALVLALTLAMCLIAGVFATRRLSRADPAQIL